MPGPLDQRDEMSRVKQLFDETFGPPRSGVSSKLTVVRSPGRVNLIGEHTDYNDGFVFPLAIEPHILLVCRMRDDDTIRLASTLYPNEQASFSIAGEIRIGEPKWANYVKGVAAVFKKAGIPLTGMDVLMSNTLPPGGGLSSSAAIEVGAARALLHYTGTAMDEQRVALLSQEAEHWAGTPSGIMDQTIVAAGRADHAMLLDCRDYSKRFVPIDSADLRVVIVNSMVKHELSGGEYAERRRQCEEGVAFFKKTDPTIKALRDVTMEQVIAAKSGLSDVVFRRCRHVVGEIARTTEAAEALEHRRYDRFGELMVQSHNSLRDDYEVSTAELDFLVEEAMSVKGVYGARMTGGGFGGCIVALVQPKRVDDLHTYLAHTFAGRFGLEPTVFVTTACDGASVVE